MFEYATNCLKAIMLIIDFNSPEESYRKYELTKAISILENYKEE